MNGKIHIKGGNIIWKQERPYTRIAFEEDVMIEGGSILIGNFKVSRNFTWKGGILSAKEAVFDIFVSNLRHIDSGNNNLLLKTININILFLLKSLILREYKDIA